MKNIVFWQENFSIHQSLIIRRLSESWNVYLVVQSENNDHRKDHGWFIPNYGQAVVYIRPAQDEVSKLIELEGAIHIFSGFGTSKFLKSIFRVIVQKGCRLGIQLEPFNETGMRGFMRKIKYKFFQLKYGEKIDFLLAIGLNGRFCYESLGFSKHKIFDWGYFTEHTHEDTYELPIGVEPKPKLIFVGSLDIRKNIGDTLEKVKNFEDKIACFTIIGTGPKLTEIRELSYPKVKLLGSVSNAKISGIMQQHDLLILPSLFDGWGAVVNEALSVGTPVLCSDSCGASALISEYNGNTFNIHQNNFESVLEEVLQKISNGFFNRNEIKKSYESSMSAPTVCNYFESIIDHLYFGKARPSVPWLNDTQ